MTRETEQIVRELIEITGDPLIVQEVISALSPADLQNERTIRMVVAEAFKRRYASLGTALEQKLNQVNNLALIA